MVKKYQLKNGLKVLLVESHKSPVVSVQAWVKTGSADESKGIEGISHFIEHLVFKGTDEFKVGEIAAQVEGDGGELNAYTSFDQTVFYVTISKHFSDTALKVVSQMMGHPVFDEKEIDNEREVVIEEIKRSIDSPHRQASRLLFSTVYKKHPYGIPVIGYEKNISTVTRNEITKYFTTRYVPENMTLIVAGDFESKEMKGLVNTYFSDFEYRKIKKIKRTPEPTQDKPRIKVKKANFEETLMHFAWRGPKVQHKDVPALDVLSFIFGQGESSRLMRALRIERPLTNYTYASVYTPIDPGFLAISSSLKIENLDEALSAINDQLFEILSVPPSAEELQKAITVFESDSFYSLETVDGIAQNFGNYEHLFGKHDYFNEFMKQVMTLKPEDITKVARKYFKPEKLTMTMLTAADEKEATKKLRSWSRGYKKIYETAKAKRLTASVAKRKRTKRLSLKPKAKEKSQVEKIVLDTGAQLLIRPVHDIPVISMRCAFLGGLRIEDKSQSGVNDLLARVWPAGTTNRTEQEIQRQTEAMASSVDAFSGRNTVGLTLKSLTPNAVETFDIFEDMLLHPLFSEESIEREKQFMIEGHKNREDNLAQLCIRKFSELLFKTHPYGRDPSGDVNCISKLKSKQVSAHLDKMKDLKNLTFSVVGDIDKEEWIERLNKTTSDLPTGAWSDTEFAFAPPTEEQKSFIERDKEQSHIVVGFPGVTFTDPRRYTLEVMQAVLSGQGGRLFMELRDKASLAYSVSPIRMDGIDAGFFGAYIGCSPEKGTKAIEMMNIEFEKLMKTKVGSEELNSAKRNLIGKHDIALQRSSSQAASVLFDEIYGVPYDETFHYAEKVQAVTSEDVIKVANDIFGQTPVISAVGQKCPWV